MKSLSQTAVIIGSTGMVGNLLLQQLLTDDAFKAVRILVRKPVTIKHPKLEIQQVNFENQEDFKLKLGAGNSIFSCIGTTQKNVGNNKNLYTKIDYDIPLNAARFGRLNGFTTFTIVSSVGASANASAFYLKLKGSLEQAIKALQYPALHIFRPSMILGERTERRFAEKTLQTTANFLTYFLFGDLRKYKAIQATTIARAMAQAAQSP